MANWVRDDAGHIKAFPVVDYELAAAQGMAVLARLVLATPLDLPGTAAVSVQLVLTPEQARLLGDAMLQAADHVCLQRPATLPN